MADQKPKQASSEPTLLDQVQTTSEYVRQKFLKDGAVAADVEAQEKIEYIRKGAEALSQIIVANTPDNSIDRKTAIDMVYFAYRTAEASVRLGRVTNPR
jgi:hypothetical protein